MKKAILEKGTYKLKEFDRTRVLGTHPRNRLKKFVRHEGFYEPNKDKDKEENKDENEKENKDKDKGENKEENKVEERLEIEEIDKRNKTKIEPTSFEIKVPTLIVI